MSDRDLFNEWAAEALMDHDEQLAYEASRNVDLGLDCGWVSDAEMRARWARERAEAMASYDPRDFGWWNSPNSKDDAA